MNELVDTHAHLEKVEDIDQALKRAKKAGVTCIITMGSNQKSNELALKISEKWSSGNIRVYPALGFHPWGLEASKIDSGLRFIQKNVDGTVGVGEIGLDYWLRNVRKEPEKRTFRGPCSGVSLRLLGTTRNQSPSTAGERGRIA